MGNAVRKQRSSKKRGQITITDENGDTVDEKAAARLTVDEDGLMIDDPESYERAFNSYRNRVTSYMNPYLEPPTITGSRNDIPAAASSASCQNVAYGLEDAPMASGGSRLFVPNPKPTNPTSPAATLARKKKAQSAFLGGSDRRMSAVSFISEQLPESESEVDLLNLDFSMPMGTSAKSATLDPRINMRRASNASTNPFINDDPIESVPLRRPLTTLGTPRSSEHGRDISPTSSHYLDLMRRLFPANSSVNPFADDPHSIKSFLIATQEWYFGKIGRREAERLLLFGDYPRGTFLIRNCDSASGAFTLSVRDWDPVQGDHVKNYKIQRSTRPGGGYFLSVRKVFKTMAELVAFHSEAPYGLHHELTTPCPRTKLSLKPLELGPRDMKMMRELTTGFYGPIYYGKLVSDGRRPEVVIKTFKPDSPQLTAPIYPEEFMNESLILRKLKSDRIIHLYGVRTTEDPYLTVTEYMMGGNLRSFLRKAESDRSIGFKDILMMAVKIAEGMAYIEKEGIVHCDLMARNIYVGKSKHVIKIGGFGLAINLDSRETQTAAQNMKPKRPKKFAIKWTAPEAAIHGRYSFKSDVWSYGALLYEMLTYGGELYTEITDSTVMQAIMRGYRMPPPRHHHCPPTIYDVMIQCWDSEPESRPTFDFLTVYLHTFIEQPLNG